MSTAVAAKGSAWRPTPFIKATFALHAAALIVFAMQPSAWPWLAALIAANHAVIIASVFCPRGRLLGANIVRLPREAAERGEVALTFDDGPDPAVTPRVLDILDRYSMKATFFCVGSRVREHPTLVEEIARRGHDVANHSYAHTHLFAMLGPRRMARDIDAAQTAIAGATGARPRYFRAPSGFRNPWMDPLLANRGLRYVAWTRRGLDTVRRDPAAVTRALTRDLAAGDVLLMHDGNCGHTADGATMVLEVLPIVLDKLRESGLKSVALPSALETN